LRSASAITLMPLSSIRPSSAAGSALIVIAPPE
jgi:hypothetical protein